MQSSTRHTESTLSPQVRQLEEQLGFELLDRLDQVRTRGGPSNPISNENDAGFSFRTTPAASPCLTGEELPPAQRRSGLYVRSRRRRNPQINRGLPIDERRDPVHAIDRTAAGLHAFATYSLHMHCTRSTAPIFVLRIQFSFGCEHSSASDVSARCGRSPPNTGSRSSTRRAAVPYDRILTRKERYHDPDRRQPFRQVHHRR
jgi:hypothetical protein